MCGRKSIVNTVELFANANILILFEIYVEGSFRFHKSDAVCSLSLTIHTSAGDVYERTRSINLHNKSRSHS
jgi:hypothetical protein